MPMSLRCTGPFPSLVLAAGSGRLVQHWSIAVIQAGPGLGRPATCRGATDRTGHLCVALAGGVAVLAVWDVLIPPVLPEDVHGEGGLVVAAVAAGLGVWGSLDSTGLGCRRAG